MKELREMKLIAVGDARVVKIPNELLERYGWTESVVLEEAEESIILRGVDEHKLSWEETFRAMAVEEEDWSDLDVTVGDGLEHL